MSVSPLGWPLACRNPEQAVRGTETSARYPSVLAWPDRVEILNKPFAALKRVRRIKSSSGTGHDSITVVRRNPEQAVRGTETRHFDGDFEAARNPVEILNKPFAALKRGSR